MPDYDGIVIGAGCGGLAAGALLAESGRRILVIEQAERIGGYCSSFQVDGFRFDNGASIVELTSIFDRCFQRLGTSLAEALDLAPLDPIYTMILGDGTRVAIPAGGDRTAETVAAIHPPDADGWRRYAKDMQGFLDVALDGFFLKPANNLGDLVRLIAGAPGILRYRSMFSDNYQNVLARYFEHPRVRECFAYQSLFAGLAPDLCPGHMAMLPWAEQTGMYYSRGGMIAIPSALAAAGARFGMQVRTGTAVKQVMLDGCRVHGVRLADGSEITAPLVVSDISAKTLYLELIGEERLPRLAAAGLRSLRESTTAVMVHLGLSGAPALESHHTLCSLPVEELNHYVHEVYRRGRLPERQIGLISWPSLSDPTCAPPGRHCVTLTWSSGAYELAGTTWDRVRGPLTEDILRYVTTHFVPGLRDQVEFVQMTTPVDFESDLLAPRGAIYMFDQDATQTTVFRPSARSRHFKGLYLAGASTHPGGGVPAVIASGMICADLVENSVENGRFGGAGRPRR